MTGHIIREIAHALDVPPADALELVRKSGIVTFWHEGQEFIGEYLDEYLREDHRYDPVPELEFDATPAQLAAILEPEISQCISDLRAEAQHNDSMSSYSPNLRRLFAVGKLLQGVQPCGTEASGTKPESPRSSSGESRP